MENYKIVLLSFVLLVKSLLSAQTFTKIETGPVVSTFGDSRSVNWVDVNNDGQIDLFISNGKAGGQNNMLYINKTNGVFEAMVNNPIVSDNKPSDGATFADTDNDGDLDAFVVNWYTQPNLYYENDGLGNFTHIASVPMTNSGGYSETAAFGDYDNDGLVDLFVTRSGPSNLTKRNQLYHNDGKDQFTKINIGEAVTQSFISRSVNWVDIDGDGDVDLFVTNEGPTANNENLFRNDGNGVFTAIATGALVNDGKNTMSSSWADYDNDGDLDVYLCNYQSNNALFRNDGNFNFTKIVNDPVSQTNSFSFSSAWSDIDNDGDLDLFVTNSFSPDIALLKNFLFINDGNGSFEKVDTGAIVTYLSWSYGCAFADYDNDGFEDLAVATVAFDGDDTPDFLYNNNANGNNWITIKLIGTKTNKTAIGTKIRVKSKINGVDVWQMREISAQSSYCSQNDLRAHFGLGDGLIIETIQIEWLSGIVETYSGINVNQFIDITEGDGIVGLNEIEEDFEVLIYPNPVGNLLQIGLIKDAQKCTIDIFNDVGQLVLNLQNCSKNESIDVSNWKAGNYYIRIQSGIIKRNIKFIKI